ncbi:hypothetical protein [Erythrobacter sanguineus]|uniref:Uncharacterized protein n=1 Tax=Erythrobacter sanguineus TaxID=198312 RepID=A0A1M7S6E0_9SPHN|nr:hypothetical protein [Erythrobacter sanguineus]SHN54021.1 hypothetical protein SAMN02745193_01080 [Erythrobacter sanguineus]
MSPEMLIPIISSIGWLVVVGAALASYRLEWGQMARMALVWLAIFVGLYVLVLWFMMAQDTAGTLV